MSAIVVEGRLICADAAQSARIAAHVPDHVRLSRSEPGCLSFEIRPTADPLVWVVRERFRDAAAFEAHKARTATSPWAAAAEGLRRELEVREVPGTDDADAPLS